jgi:hypothetical protein
MIFSVDELGTGMINLYVGMVVEVQKMGPNVSMEYKYRGGSYDALDFVRNHPRYL